MRLGKKGFTLVELVIVIAVVAVISTVVVMLVMYFSKTITQNQREYMTVTDVSRLETRIKSYLREFDSNEYTITVASNKLTVTKGGVTYSELYLEADGLMRKDKASDSPLTYDETVMYSLDRTLYIRFTRTAGARNGYSMIKWEVSDSSDFSDSYCYVSAVRIAATN